MKIISWMQNSFGFNLLIFFLIVFNLLAQILAGTMGVLLFFFDAIILYVVIDNILRIREEKKQTQEEDKSDDS